MTAGWLEYICVLLWFVSFCFHHFLDSFFFFPPSLDATLCLLLDFSPLSIYLAMIPGLLPSSHLPPTCWGLFLSHFASEGRHFFGISCMIWRGLAFLKAFHAVARELGMG
jgi:hypothetical protein